LLSTSGGNPSCFYLPINKSIPIEVSPVDVTSVAFHPLDNNIFVFGYRDGSIQVYKCKESSYIRCSTVHKSDVTSLSFAKSNTLLSTGEDRVGVWECTSLGLNILNTFPVGSKRERSATQFHENNEDCLVWQPSAVG
jgi:WD40 repeat protein